METTANKSAEPLMTPEEVADYLKIAASTVRQWVKLDKIPFVKVGSLTRFRRAEIDQWIILQTAEAEDAA
jgi:excisionase family DNA binding protein